MIKIKDNINIEELKKRIIPILKKYGVTRAGIFGSYARGEQNNKSDVDILIELKEDYDLIEYIQLKNIIENTIKKKIDLVEYSTIRQELRNNILNEEIPIEI